MKKTLSFTLLLSMCLFSTSAFAANWELRKQAGFSLITISTHSTYKKCYKAKKKKEEEDPKGSYACMKVPY